MAEKILFNTELTDMDTSDLDGVGNVKKEKDGKVYRYVKNRNATAIGALATCCYDVDNIDGTETDYFESVNMPVSADIMMAAGIAVTAFGISGAACYGWIQIRGHCRNVPTRNPKSTAIAVGAELITANGVGTLTKSATAAAGIAVIYSNHFIAAEAVATDGTGTATIATDVIINCL